MWREAGVEEGWSGGRRGVLEGSVEKAVMKEGWCGVKLVWRKASGEAGWHGVKLVWRKSGVEEG